MEPLDQPIPARGGPVTHQRRCGERRCHASGSPGSAPPWGGNAAGPSGGQVRLAQWAWWAWWAGWPNTLAVSFTGSPQERSERSGGSNYPTKWAGGHLPSLLRREVTAGTGACPSGII